MTETMPTAPPRQELLSDVVSTLVALDQTLNQLQSLRASLLATAHRIADDDPQIEDVRSREMAHRAVATELGSALRVSDRTLERQMGDSFQLLQNFPATAAAFQRGRISPAHVRVITEAGAEITDAARRAAFEEAVLDKAGTDSPNRLRPFAKRLSEHYREVSFQERSDQARMRRAAWVRDLEDGQSQLCVTGPSAIIHGIFERITQMSHAVKTENDQTARAQKARAQKSGMTGSAAADLAGAESALDERVLNEIRADLAADLLLSGVPSGHDTLAGLLGSIQGFVEVTIPVTTLTRAGAGEPPAQLEGIGPVDPETARILAGNAPGWDRVMTDPVSGAVLSVDRYRPSEEMRRHLRARDRRCRFPGCGIIARKCDDDHTVDHAHGGATDVENLAGTCRRHHVTKHHTPWKVKQLGGGVLEWTSPTGRRHVDRPPGTAAHVTFADIAARSEAHAADIEGPIETVARAPF
ncbi:hypothetical protein FM104_05945 [Microbacterium esteraromaticum]|uniref:HNH nuclease domain-containing protein n=1 Tax=Microbacterium esteraromaticum TaxID=57043 RepID=A0A1R4J8K6_9MICO|nr:HNH endonuclease signature motif containing protein [Microbacterium esteraromaticum]SJN28234.1 hypothetical protein FM104_05945 [Microbacterium esteraromaticum]